jgi:hypothetical protein
MAVTICKISSVRVEPAPVIPVELFNNMDFRSCIEKYNIVAERANERAEVAADLVKTNTDLQTLLGLVYSMLTRREKVELYGSELLVLIGKTIEKCYGADKRPDSLYLTHRGIVLEYRERDPETDLEAVARVVVEFQEG